MGFATVELGILQCHDEKIKYLNVGIFHIFAHKKLFVLTSGYTVVNANTGVKVTYLFK